MDNTDPNDGYQYWWVNNDAWSGSHGPQTINVCSQSTWYAVSDQTDNGGQIETYPDTEYDVGGRNNPSTTPISGFSSITSTFSEAYPSAGGWDAAYDLWTDNWTNETMIWNQWAGDNAYWAECANNEVSGGCGTEPGVALTLGGVPYHFLANGPTHANGTPIPCTAANESKCEYMFFRDSQVSTGSVDDLGCLAVGGSERLRQCERRPYPAGVRRRDLLHERRGDVPDDGSDIQRDPVNSRRVRSLRSLHRAHQGRPTASGPTGRRRR